VGWRKLGEDWAYLHAGGGITAAGLNAAVNVELDGKLAGYHLPEPPTGEALVEAVRDSLGLLDLAPHRLTATGLGAVYRAALGPADASLFYDGPSGGFKSEWTALLQQHYGASMARLNLPGNWSSTPNAIERQLFLAKDALFVLDDFKPGGSRSAVDDWHARADRVFRSVGNSSSRGRCWADGSLRADNPPRCLLIASGEDRPRGESCAARRLDVHVRHGDVPAHLLSVCQGKAASGAYALATAAYLRWLAGRYDQVKASLPEGHARLRDQSARDGHPRTPGIVADLALGWKTFLDFAREAGALTATQYEETWSCAWRGLLGAAAEQDGEVQSQEPARRFLDLVRSALSSKRAHLGGVDDGQPPDPGRWGWRDTDVPTNEGHRTRWDAQGKLVGWTDGTNIYLEPESAFAEAQKLAEDQGERLTVSRNQLQRRLKEKGFLASTRDNKSTNQRVIQGVKTTVLHVVHWDRLSPRNGDIGDIGATAGCTEWPQCPQRAGIDAPGATLSAEGHEGLRTPFDDD
jgi:hypothetical protein